MSIVGLVQKDIEVFLDNIKKANEFQLKAMLTSLQGELKQRQLLKGINGEDEKRV